MRYQNPFFRSKNIAIHYKGFLFLKQPNKSWLVRPKKSPMILLPFRTHICSITEAKKILDLKLRKQTYIEKAA